jgi:hypothetical protein
MFSEQNPQEPSSGHASDNSTQSPSRRLAQRGGREKGLRVFIPAKVLEAAGIELAELDGEPPVFYALQAVKDRPRRRSVIVRLYPR